MKKFITAFFLLYCQSLVAQTIAVNTSRYQIDRANRIIVCNQLPASGTVMTGIQLDSLYTLAEPTDALRLNQTYSVSTATTVYQLFFTKSPLISIDTRMRAISRDSVIAGSVQLTDTLNRLGKSAIGINVRGAFSSTFPKRSYKVNFFIDSTLTTKKDTSLLGMRTDSEWLLLAMYNEALRVQNATAHALWLSMHKLYYQAEEPTAKSGISTRYADLFLNGVYQGIYLLTESMDRKQLQLKKTRANGQVRGELYKAVDYTAGTVYVAVPTDTETRETWGGFELKYPNDTTFWTNLKELLTFVSTNTSQSFTSRVAQRMKIDNLVDYLLFINVARATDNMGKNTYTARYKEGDPYFFIPWDLDGTWGYLWSGARLPQEDVLLINGFFGQLLDDGTGDFKKKVKKRYFSLRPTLFSASALKGALSRNVTMLDKDGAYRREATRWPLADINDELTYSLDFVDRRLAYLDALFSSYPDECANPPVPTVTTSATQVAAGESLTLVASGCPYTVLWNTGEIGNRLVVHPQRSFAYAASCYQTGATCGSAFSTPLSVSVTEGIPATTYANLTVRATSDRRTGAIGQPISVTLTIGNQGPDVAYAVRIQNRLPTGLQYVDSPEASLTCVAGIVNGTLDSLRAGDEWAAVYRVKASQSGAFSNAAQILDGATFDPDSRPGSGTGDGENDMAQVDLRIGDATAVYAASANPNQWPLPAVLSSEPPVSLTVADLSLQVVASQRAVRPNMPISLTVIVSNQGSLTATGVTLAGTLPPSATFVSGENLQLTAGKLTSTTPLTVLPGQAIRLSCTLQVAESEYVNSRWQILSSDQPDPDSTPGNGTDTGEDDEATESWRVR
ncbi:CotH kinase family protein [Fibrella arboris]|uniref:CotH kinase family protein n=1 Tax=Fibrella arboris TaxID=3242486 RepID=UPI003520FB20